MGAAKHDQDSCEQRRQGVEVPMARPEIREETEKQDMEGNPDVDRRAGGQQQVGEIHGVEQGGLETTEKRRPGKEVGIPEGEVAMAQLPEAEVAPVEKLRGDVGMDRREDLIASGKEDIAEHEEGEDEINGQRPRPGEARKGGGGTAIYRFMIHVGYSKDSLITPILVVVNPCSSMNFLATSLAISIVSEAVLPWATNP